MSGGRDGVTSVGRWSESSSRSGADQRAPRLGGGEGGSGCSVDRDQLSTTHCRAFAGSQDHSLPVALRVTQFGALRHTVAGEKKNSWNMRIEAIQRRPRVLNREELPWNLFYSLFYLKTLTYTVELYLFEFFSSSALPCNPSLRSP